MKVSTIKEMEREKNPPASKYKNRRVGIGRITYYASNDTMGDSTPDYCDRFREFAKTELEREFGHDFDIMVSAEQSFNEVIVDFDDAERSDFDLEERIQRFAHDLWDDFGNK